jgi:hypothetical protein
MLWSGNFQASTGFCLRRWRTDDKVVLEAHLDPVVWWPFLMRPDTAGGRSRDGSLWFHQTCKKSEKVHTHLIKVPVHEESIVANPHNCDASLMRILLITLMRIRIRNRIPSLWNRNRFNTLMRILLHDAWSRIRIFSIPDPHQRISVFKTKKWFSIMLWIRIRHSVSFALRVKKYRVAAIFPEHFESLTVTLKNHIFNWFFRAIPYQLFAEP